MIPIVPHFFRHASRLNYVPALVWWWHILATLAFFAAVGKVLLASLGLTVAIIVIVALRFALAGVLRNAAPLAYADWDVLRLRIPAVSTLYQDWFRAETYWREDTRTIYLQRIPQVIREVAEEITAAKGAKLMRQYHYAPILGELYKPVAQRPEQNGISGFAAELAPAKSSTSNP